MPAQKERPVCHCAADTPAERSRPGEREIVQAIVAFEFTRAVQAYASELDKVAAEFEAIAEKHRRIADEVELPRPPGEQTRARLLGNLTRMRDALEAAIVGHGSTRREQFVSGFPHPLGSMLARLHLETEPCDVGEVSTEAEVPGAHRRCASKFISAAETVHRWLTARDLGAKLREAGRGDGGARVDVARRDLVAWAKAAGLGYKALAGELAAHGVALEAAATPPYRWSERRISRGARPIGIANPFQTHVVVWDETNPRSPQPVLQPRPDYAKQPVHDSGKLRDAWETRLKRAFAERRNGGTKHSQRG